MEGRLVCIMFWAMSTTLCIFLWSWMELFPNHAEMHHNKILYGASVEVGEGCWGHAEPLKSSKEVEALVCIDHCFDMAGPGQVAEDIYSKELEGFKHLHCQCISGYQLHFLKLITISFVLLTLRERLLSCTRLQGSQSPTSTSSHHYSAHYDGVTCKFVNWVLLVLGCSVMSVQGVKCRECTGSKEG